jgi:hypothetical protein
LKPVIFTPARSAIKHRWRRHVPAPLKPAELAELRLHIGVTDAVRHRLR